VLEAPSLAAHRNFVLQFFCLEVSDEAVDHVGDVAFHDAIELMQGETDAVIGEAILGEIVGADFFAAIARADHAAALSSDGLLLLFELDFVEARTQDALGFGAGDVRAVTYEYGNAFVMTAGLLNFLVVIDAYDIALGRK